MTIQHLRSSTANKRPTAAAMSDGQLAVNTNATNPGLFFKDADGSIRKVGPVFIGSSAPNSSPATGGSTGHAVGEQWLDNTGGTYVLKIWDGTAWRSESGTFVDVSGDTMTGALGVVAGSGSAPGVFFSGDTNTGIYSPGADQLALATNGTGRLFVNSSGNVAIGTTSALQSAGFTGVTASGSTGGIYWLAKAGAQKGYLYGQDNDVTLASTDASGVIRLLTGGNTERMRIDSSGRVGVGTSSPYSITGANTLSVHNSSGSSEINFLSSTTGFGALYFGDATSGVDRYAGYLEYKHSNNYMRFATASNERMRIDSSGRVGIGTSATSSYSAIADNLLIAGSSNTGMSIIDSGDSTQSSLYFYGGTTRRHYIEGGSGGSGILTIQSNNAVKFNIGTSERMRIDSSGNVGINNSSPGSYASDGRNLVVGSGSGSNGITIASGASNSGTIYFADGTSGASLYTGTITYNHSSNHMAFWANETERMRITSSGYFKAAYDGNYLSSSAAYHEFTGNSANSYDLRVVNDRVTPLSQYIVELRFRNSTPNNSNARFIDARDSTGQRFYVLSNGGIGNYQSNNSNLCDEREKKNIETLDSTWGCLKNWDLKKFHYNEDADTDDKRYGVIAQQVAEYCPEVITDWTKQKAEDAVLDEDGNVVTPAVEEVTRMAVKEQQMMWMAIKALQEAQARIETLEQRLSDAGIA